MHTSITIRLAPSDPVKNLRGFREITERFVRDLYDWDEVRITERATEIRIDGISADTSEASSA